VLITRGQTIDGFDAVEVRDLLRRVMRYAFTREGFAQLFDRAGAGDPAMWFEMLERHGLIASGAEVHAGRVVHGDGEDVRDTVLWQTTVGGNALAKAASAHPCPAPAPRRCSTESSPAHKK
jgi:hypothetical protein